MRKLQCAECDIGGSGHYTARELGYKDHGKVTSKKDRMGELPGLIGEFPVRIYGVTCQKCGRTWRYRKKWKEPKTQNRKRK